MRRRRPYPFQPGQSSEQIENPNVMSQNYGTPDAGQFQQTDTPAPPAQQDPQQAFRPSPGQAAAPVPQAPPPPPAHMGRDAQDPTKMARPRFGPPQGQWGQPPGMMTGSGQLAPGGPPQARPDVMPRMRSAQLPPPIQQESPAQIPQTPAAPPPSPAAMTLGPSPSPIAQASQQWMDSGFQPPPAAPPQGVGPTLTGYAPQAPEQPVPNDPWAAQAPPGAPQAFDPNMPLTMGQVSFGQFGKGAPQQNPMAFEGFNDERALASGDDKSAKDAFRRIIGGSGIDVRGLSKPEVGAKLEAEVVPLLQSQGYPARVKPGEYDIIEIFSNERGWEPIDVVRGAGSAEAAWQWGDQPGQGAPQGEFNPAYLQQAAQGASPDELDLARQIGLDPDNNPLWKQMFDQWYAQQADEPSTTDPAFMAQFDLQNLPRYTP